MKTEQVNSKSLIEMYKEAQALPSPAQQLVNRVMAATQAKEVSVRLWLLGHSKPGRSTLLLLEKEFATPWQILFPDAVNNKEK